MKGRRNESRETPVLGLVRGDAVAELDWIDGEVSFELESTPAACTEEARKHGGALVLQLNRTRQ